MTKVKPKGDHDRLADRLPEILYKLNQGYSLNPADLADEFKVTIRTIQRDLNVRLAYLPLDKIDGRYKLEQSFLGKFNKKDIEHFAGLAGIRGLYPSLSDDFLRDIFDNRMQDAMLIKGHNYEDISGKKDLFRAVEKAIVAHHSISFDYLRGEEHKPYKVLQPYKLLNNKGIWYVAAVDDGKLKTFAFSRIHQLHVESQQFQPDPQINQRLIEEEGIWFSEEKREILLKVSCEVAGYFKRRKLIANQIIEKELEDGGLIISAKVGHPNQILPIVRYWIPHIRIISPEGLQTELESELAEYLNN